jgi:hypothetical protein
MSRVTYTDTPATAAQEALRVTHRVRLVAAAEEGTGLDALPGGVYGFTYSPGLPNAPLFTTRRFRNYEIHKLAGGEAFIVGFVEGGSARKLASEGADVSVQLKPEPEEGSGVLVTIPYARIRQHRQYAAPNQHGFSVTVAPARERIT